MRNRTLGLFMALMLLAPSANAQATASRFAPIRDTIAAILATGNHVSITVAVARGDSILWAEGFGFADRERQIRATPETMYSLASISKPFTATGVMLLAQRGRLDIDRPANEYLGAAKLRAYEGAASEMTLRRILSHSAGLPLHYQFFYEGVANVHSDDVAITKYGFAGYTPGETYFYSNLGFGILGYIAGRVAGKDYVTFMKDEVFTPLGLRNTTVSTGAGLSDRAAIRYDAALKPIPPYAFDHAGASAVWSSANDLVRFGMFHTRLKAPHSLLSPTTRERMQRAEAPETAPGASYGLGWGLLENDNGYRRVSHTGGMPGVTTVLNLYPSEEVAIVVLANTGGAPVGRVANAIARVMLPSVPAVAGTRGGPPPAVLSTLAGTWRGSVLVDGKPTPLIITARDDGAMRAQLGAGEDLPLAGPSLNSATGWFSGRVNGVLRAPDATPAAAADSVRVALSLRLHGDRLTGWASSLSAGQRAYGAVSYWTELTRQR